MCKSINIGQMELIMILIKINVVGSGCNIKRCATHASVCGQFTLKAAAIAASAAA